MARSLAVLAALMLLAGCGGSGVGQAARPLPEPTSGVRSETLGDGRERFWPRSAPVDEDFRYRMTAYTHCGLDYLLDFDGSFWEVTSGPAYHQDLDDPVDEGVITRVGDDAAVYESSGGVEFDLRRIDGPREVHLCE